MSAWWSRWVELCARREDGLSVALVRIGVALIVGFHIVHLYASGALELVWLDAAHGGMRMIDGGVLRYFGGAVPELPVAGRRPRRANPSRAAGRSGPGRWRPPRWS